ncbi:MAG: hypothetical protein HKM93_20660 [Desulfobacteraceae bacterium]|nr:hypothetical protein [Desulfobacteraceae bacterium]
MKLLIYQPDGHPLENVLRQGLTTKGHEIESFFFPDIAALTAGLRQASGGDIILILVPPDKKELSRLAMMRAPLLDKKIILILPDNREETISTAHRLHPRYISDADGDFSDTIAVLSKMIGNAGSHAPGELIADPAHG